jgi:hypothetical protein
VRTQDRVPRGLSKAQRLDQVALSQGVLAAVERHPPREVRGLCGNLVQRLLDPGRLRLAHDRHHVVRQIDGNRPPDTVPAAADDVGLLERRERGADRHQVLLADAAAAAALDRVQR